MISLEEIITDYRKLRIQELLELIWQFKKRNIELHWQLEDYKRQSKTVAENFTFENDELWKENRLLKQKLKICTK